MFPVISSSLLLSFMNTEIYDISGEICQCGIFQYPRPIVKFDTIECPLVTDDGASQNPYIDTPFPEYPRPQMKRKGEWINLNGFWEFESAASKRTNLSSQSRQRRNLETVEKQQQQQQQQQQMMRDKQSPPSIPLSTPLASQIVVPYPPESCLSGIWLNHYGDDKIPKGPNSWTAELWYRKEFELVVQDGAIILHFEASDWTTHVYFNGKYLGHHVGGYTPFSFTIPSYRNGTNEVLVYTYDPTDYGSQPAGKQRLSAMTHSKGTTYSPTSGIWQTVWIEYVREMHITDVIVDVTLHSVTLNVETNVMEEDVAFPYRVQIYDDKGTVLVDTDGDTGIPLMIEIPEPVHWSPDHPYLYDAVVTLDDNTTTHSGDEVTVYFGLREFGMEIINGVMRPTLNNEPIFLSGWLDQSWWPDGMYTPPSTKTMTEDIQYAKDLGFNMIRMHIKVNPRTWYSYADHVGMIVFQDIPQHYRDEHKIKPSQDYYTQDMKEIIKNRYNHPSIMQWTLFNEDDMVKHFNVSKIVDLARNLDNYRLLDANSGGPANEFHYGDVNDLHSYAYSKHFKHYPFPDFDECTNQYCMYGEWGGFGHYVKSHTWRNHKCDSYIKVRTPEALLDTYISAITDLLHRQVNNSASIITQATDVERECNGFMTYDRQKKFNDFEEATFKSANLRLIELMQIFYRSDHDPVLIDEIFASPLNTPNMTIQS